MLLVGRDRPGRERDSQESLPEDNHPQVVQPPCELVAREVEEGWLAREEEGRERSLERVDLAVDEEDLLQRQVGVSREAIQDLARKLVEASLVEERRIDCRT